MWQRFSDSARKVVYYAQEEAQRFGTRVIDPEHLLLGITHNSLCVGSRVLTQLGTRPDLFDRIVSAQLPRGPQNDPSDLTLSPRSKQVVDFAYEEARNLNHNYIGTEHLLLGLLNQVDGIASEVLNKKGVTLDAARKEVISMVGKGAKLIPEPHPTQPRDIPASSKAVTVLAARKQRMMADQLCLMFLFEAGGYAEQAVVGCGVEIDSLALLLEEDFLAMKTPEQILAGFLNASQLLELAIVEAHHLSQFLNSSHFLLAAHAHGNNATARALSALGVSVDTLRDWVSGHP